MQRSILCFGDSNTWGANPSEYGGRFSPEQRWGGVLQAALGADFRVIEEGLSGRTTLWRDSIEDYTCGRDYLIPCLHSHKPLDLLIILLGTNDLKRRFNLSPFDVAQGAGKLVQLARQQTDCGIKGHPPDVLLICPPPFAKMSRFADLFAGGAEKSRELGAYFRQVAAELDCPLLEAGNFMHSSDLDGIHWETDQHQNLGRAVADWIKTYYA